MFLTAGLEIDLTQTMSKGTRIRLTGKRRNSTRGPLLVVADGDVWVLEGIEGSELPANTAVTVEGIQTGLDRIHADWIGRVADL
jgi:hypothetical protein